MEVKNMSENNKPNQEQLYKVAGGSVVIKYICDECSNEIPSDAEERIDSLQSNLNDPNSINAKVLKKCPYCDKFVEFHRVLA